LKYPRNNQSSIFKRRHIRVRFSNLRLYIFLCYNKFSLITLRVKTRVSKMHSLRHDAPRSGEVESRDECGGRRHQLHRHASFTQPTGVSRRMAEYILEYISFISIVKRNGIFYYLSTTDYITDLLILRGSLLLNTLLNTLLNHPTHHRG